MPRTRILVVSAVVLIGGAIALLVGLTPQQETSPATTQAVGLVLHGYDAEGRSAWTVQAVGGAIAGDLSALTNATLLFYREGQEALRAQGATLTYSGKEAVLTGNVDVTSADGYRVTPDQLVWNESTHDLVAGRVTIASDTVSVEAQGFRYDLDDGHWSLSDGFVATIEQPSSLHVTGKTAAGEADHLTLAGELTVEGEDDTYSCAEIEYVLGSQEVRLSGGVEGVFSSGTLSAGELTLTPDGSSAGGGVHLVLEGGFFGGEGGA